jgi:murein L,D-transpeptidase YcbB/YkuD
VRYRQALLEQGDQLFLAQPPPPMRQRRAVERQLVTEAQFTAEELVIRVLQPARAQRLVRQVVHVLQNQQPRYQSRRQARLTGSRRADAGKAAVEKPPIDHPRQPRQRMAEIDDILQRRPQQILLTIVPWLRHRVPPR